MTVNFFETEEEKRRINKAIDCLDDFCKNWCVNFEQTKSQGDLVFRCAECPFESGDLCKLKIFVEEQVGKERLKDFGSMS